MAHEEQKTRFIELRAQGHSYAAIAKELQVSKGTLTAWNTELEAEIARARAVELEDRLDAAEQNIRLFLVPFPVREFRDPPRRYRGMVRMPHLWAGVDVASPRRC